MSAGTADAVQIRAALDAWNTGRIRSLHTPATGTINQTTVVEAEHGRFILRNYAHRDPDRIPLEHALIEWVSERGIPAPQPLETRAGRTWMEIDSRYFALFEFASGQQVARESLTHAHIHTMGSFLADLHATLGDYPIDRVRKRGFGYDPEGALREIDRFRHLIRELSSSDPVDAWALDRLEGRRQWVLGNHNTSMDTFLALPQQTTHGDYQESNLFFQDDRVTGIIDWEQAYGAPRGYEVMRVLHLALRFDPDMCRAFVSAYRERGDLTFDDLDTCAHAYAMHRGHSLWMFEEIYDLGNDRMRRFMNPGPFKPVDEQWAPVRAILAE